MLTISYLFTEEEEEENIQYPKTVQINRQFLGSLNLTPKIIQPDPTIKEPSPWYIDMLKNIYINNNETGIHIKLSGIRG